MSIWPFGGNFFLATRNGEDVDKGFPEPFGRSLGLRAPKLSKRDCKPEEQDRGLPERLRLKLHSDNDTAVHLTPFTTAALLPAKRYVGYQHLKLFY